jgi:signal transduction histidine kinase
MTNAVTEGTLPYGGEDALFSTHIGLASMQSRATDAGGTISMGPVAETPSLWRTALSLPIVE